MLWSVTKLMKAGLCRLHQLQTNENILVGLWPFEVLVILTCTVNS